MTFETVIIYRFKSYDIWYMYDSPNNVIGFEYSQLSEINETLKTKRIYYEENLQGDVTGLLDARGAKLLHIHMMHGEMSSQKTKRVSVMKDMRSPLS